MLLAVSVFSQGQAMIDILKESLVEMRHAPREIEKFLGRRLHLGTIYRWCTTGVRGVRLESIVMGGGRYTSLEAMARFAEELTRTRSEQHDAPSQRKTSRADRARKKQLDAEADKWLRDGCLKVRKGRGEEFDEKGGSDG